MANATAVSGTYPPVSDEALAESWKDLNNEFEELDNLHKNYVTTLGNLVQVQEDCSKRLKNFNKHLAQFREVLKRGSSSEFVSDILTEIQEKKVRYLEIEETLPRSNNGLYLNIILGSVDVSLLNKSDRFRYKDEYEKFKFVLNIISIAMAFVAYMLHVRALDAMYNFLLVWYYCTLTIRESILQINGSRIKGWWVIHHYISAVICGIGITWPEGECYQSFRLQFLAFSMYLSFVQLMQRFYQRGVLYRLRALGLRHSMDVTVEGFHSWMFRGLSFLLPFLLFGYAFQMYNAFVLFRLYYKIQCGWQVLALAFLFVFVSVMNTYTTLSVVYRKYSSRDKPSRRRRLETKYSLDEVDSQSKQM